MATPKWDGGLRQQPSKWMLIRFAPFAHSLTVREGQRESANGCSRRTLCGAGDVDHVQNGRGGRLRKMRSRTLRLRCRGKDRGSRTVRQWLCSNRARGRHQDGAAGSCYLIKGSAMDIIERLRFDAARCEATFSKGVASNIEAAADEIERMQEALIELVTLGD